MILDRMNKIVVLHVIQSPGGVERYIRSFLKYVDRDNFINILVCSKEYKKEYYVDLVDEFVNINMTREIRFKSDLSSIILIRKLIKKYKPDIVYCHSSKAGAIGRIANIGIHNKCIYNPHGWAFNMGQSKMKKKCYTLIEKVLAPLAYKIICISESEQVSAIKNRICKKDKTVIIYNGIDFEEYDNPQEKLLRSDLGISDDKFIIGFTGRLSEQKAPDVFMNAAKYIKSKIPNAYFLIVGDGEQREKIEKFFNNNEMKDCYRITGWVENPMSYINIFDVATLLSRWEGFGLVLAEYMQAKKPIVATKVDAIPYIIEHEKNGLLVDIDDYENVGNMIMKLFQDPSLRDKLIANGYTIVREKYDARRVVREHEYLFANNYES